MRKTMPWVVRISSLLVVAFLSTLCSKSTYAGELLGHPDALDGPADLIHGGVWSNTTPFNNGMGLSGYIEWAVFGPYDDPYPGSTSIPGEFVYAYQVYSTGTEAIQSIQMPSFEDGNERIGTLNELGGVPPVSMSLGNRPAWEFAGLNAGEHSTGLMFSALKRPGNGYGVVVNKQGFALSVPLPTVGFHDLGYGNPFSGSGVVPGYRGDQYFYGPASASYESADISYAVFEPGAFNAQFPGQDPSGGTDYVYAYRIVCMASEISTFTVGLDGDEQPRFVGFVDDARTVSPSNASLVGDGPTSVAWDFAPGTLTNEPWQLDQVPSSAILFFTSPNPPEADTATLVAAGWADTIKLPSPTPEPASICLLGISAGGAITRRLRSG